MLSPSGLNQIGVLRNADETAANRYDFTSSGIERVRRLPLFLDDRGSEPRRYSWGIRTLWPHQDAMDAF